MMGSEVKEVGRAPGSQTIFYFRLGKGPNGYSHYLYCPLMDRMVWIKGETGEKVSPDIFEKAVKQFQKMLGGNKRGLR